MKEVVLKTNNLTKQYNKNVVLDNVNITIKKGDIYGLIGRNGAGKTTLMKIITTLASPTSGTFELFNTCSENDELFDNKKRVGSLIEYPAFYPNYKKKCDEYFWNAHRFEARGIGGLFFDYLKETQEMKMEDWYNFVTEVGNSFLEAYVPIVEKRKDLSFTEVNRTWQEIRRGRYVEFNLVHDKGTLFGLKTNGRIESILMSLPPHVQWVYDHHPEAGSEEEKLIKTLENPKDWLVS